MWDRTLEETALDLNAQDLAQNGGKVNELYTCAILHLGERRHIDIEKQ
jgi:hypothetical protein